MLLFGLSCKKGNNIVTQDQQSFEKSIFEDQPGKFKKELIVEDETKKNRVYLAIYSDDSVKLNKYINETNLLLIKSTESSLKSSFQYGDNSINSSENDSLSKIVNNRMKNNLDSLERIGVKPSITVEIISENTDDKTVNFNLKVSSKNNNNLKAVSDCYFVTGQTPGVEYVVKGESFIGVSQYGHHSIYARISACKSITSSWSIIFDDFLGTDWLTNVNIRYLPKKHATSMPTDPAYSQYNYKRKIYVIPCADGVSGNYVISYSKTGVSGFRGQKCYNNYYFDSRNCLVGVPPAGTTAFVWNGQFYYTPINGKQCPMANSGFDGANCIVKLPLPTDNSPYIYANRFYILPQLIDGNQE